MRVDYDKLTDNEIIELISDKDDAAMEFMMKKYGGIVKKEIRTVYIIGAETEDLTQEGMIGLFKAIRDYEPDKGAAFSTFATLCIRRQIKTAISASNRKKHIPLNSYISIYAESDEYGSVLADDLEAETKESNPEEMIIAKEQQSVLINRIKSELSPLENKVLGMFLDGMSYADIALKLNKTPKSIDNALQRIRNKLSK
ncbi:MAG: sigma-70 family RNA polymerase sigma factor [Lachnospiraceae bacterium]|nr:sigma-70 family RNA polymerase sigma factor [Lachnospiraceae bacterium]